MYIRNSVPPSDVMDLLNDLNVVDLFQKDFFLRTNPLCSRNVIDLPMSMFDKNYAYDNWIVGAEFFWNFTDRSFFDRKNDSIKAYLAIGDKDLLERLTATAKEFEFDFDALEAVSLFDNVTIQQRRLGLIMQAEKIFGSWHIAGKIPLYYLERNFWFTEKEQKAIEDRFGAISEKEKLILQKEHLVSDKIGFGDLRFMVDKEIETEGKKYVGVRFFTNTKEYVNLYYDAPAINIDLEKVILKINGERIKSVDNLKEKLSRYSPGENIT